MASKLSINKKKVSESDFNQILMRMAPHKEMVSACQMDEPFTVTDEDGNKIEGEPGDYLIKYNNDSLGVVSKAYFEEFYSYGRS